jgi:hypothetical protein
MDTHVEDLITNPTRHFDHPVDVLNEATLSIEEKRRILESWKQDALRLAESTAENMSGGEETDLRDVSKVLVQLKGMEDTPVVRQPDRSTTRGVGVGMTLGGLVGAGAGLLINTFTVASLAVVAQAAVVGVIIGGVGVTLRNAVRK